MSKDFFYATRQALLSNPYADRLHFILYTNKNNLKLPVPAEERYPIYEVRIIVNIALLRPNYTDDDLYTCGVLLALYEQYKRDLVLH